MSKLETGICPQCGREFVYYPSCYEKSDGIKVHCSRKCYEESTHIWTACPQCGKKFWYHQSWPRKYCSHRCSALANRNWELSPGRPKKYKPIVCEQCGKVIESPRWEGRKFCSQKCVGAWKAKHNTGPNHPSFNSIERTCEICGKPFVAQPCEVKKGWARFCSRDCKAQWQRENPPEHRPPVMYGPDNPKWKGGYEPYYGPNWRQQRRNARRRDNYTCQRCGVTEAELGRQLDVHHIVAFHEFGLERYKEANTVSNLISLCNKCHTTLEPRNS